MHTTSSRTICISL